MNYLVSATSFLWELYSSIEFTITIAIAALGPRTHPEKNWEAIDLKEFALKLVIVSYIYYSLGLEQ